MSDEATAVEANDDALTRTAKRASSVKAIAGLIFLFLGSGATAMAYLSRYAVESDEAAKHAAATLERAEIKNEVNQLKTRLTVVEVLMQDVRAELHEIKSEMRWQRSQQEETARRVGARVVPHVNKEK